MWQKLLKKLNFRHWSLQTWLRWLVALMPLAIMLPHTLGFKSYESVVRLDQRVYDQRLQWFTADNQSDERIVIIDIDEHSLARYGRWPWRRDVMAKLAKELLQRQEVALLGFDVLFAEPEIAPFDSASSKPSRIEQMHDMQLAISLTQQPAILGYYISDDKQGGKNGILSPPLTIRSVTHTPSSLLSVHSYAANMPILVQAAAGGGFMNALRDSDGQLRGVPLVAKGNIDHAGQYYPSLSLAMFLHILNQPQIEIVTTENTYTGRYTMAGLRLHQGERSLYIPTDPQGAMLVPYRGSGGKKGGQFKYISAADILDGKLPEDTLHGRVAILGSSAAGLRDLRVTPVNIQYPGVEVHASSLSAMLDGHFIYTPDYATGYSATMVFLAVLILAVVLPKVGPWGAWLWCFGLALSMTALNFWLYVQAHVALPLAASVTTIFIHYILHMFYAFTREHRARKTLATQFGSYIPPELVRTMLEQPAQRVTQAQSRELTIMFCDIQGFTKMAEGMEPVQVQEILNRLFNRITQTIKAHQGTIDKYIGDSVMAFWGAPKELAKHASHAMHSANDMLKMLENFNQEQAQVNLPPIQLGIGINTGVVSVGDMGSDLRRSYTVLGDAVNLAARIEPLARTYGAVVIVGARTAELTPDIHWQWVDYVRVSGREQAEQIYTPFETTEEDGGLNVLQQREQQRWEDYRNAYVQRQWQVCKEIMDYLVLLRPNKKLYSVHSDRIHAFLAFPPGEHWDGVTDQTK